jgi:hypothetical protein
MRSRLDLGSVPPDGQKMRLLLQLSASFSLIASAIAPAFPLYGQANVASEASPPASVEDFQKIEDRWSKAIAGHDQYDLEFLLAPEMLDISSAGQLTTRNQQIANILSKNQESLSIQERVSNVRVFTDVAIVIGTYIDHVRVKNQFQQDTGVFTHVYYRVHNHWVCINAQRTTITVPMRSKGRDSKGSPNRGQPPAISLPWAQSGIQRPERPVDRSFFDITAQAEFHASCHYERLGFQRGM